MLLIQPRQHFETPNLSRSRSGAGLTAHLSLEHTEALDHPAIQAAAPEAAATAAGSDELRSPNQPLAAVQPAPASRKTSPARWQSLKTAAAGCCDIRAWVSSPATPAKRCSPGVGDGSGGESGTAVGNAGEEGMPPAKRRLFEPAEQAAAPPANNTEVAAEAAVAAGEAAPAAVGQQPAYAAATPPRSSGLHKHAPAGKGVTASALAAALSGAVATLGLPSILRAAPPTAGNDGNAAAQASGSSSSGCISSDVIAPSEPDAACDSGAAAEGPGGAGSSSCSAISSCADIAAVPQPEQRASSPVPSLLPQLQQLPQPQGGPSQPSQPGATQRLQRPPQHAQSAAQEELAAAQAQQPAQQRAAQVSGVQAPMSDTPRGTGAQDAPIDLELEDDPVTPEPVESVQSPGTQPSECTFATPDVSQQCSFPSLESECSATVLDCALMIYRQPSCCWHPKLLDSYM